jgi:hypothetical protein
VAQHLSNRSALAKSYLIRQGYSDYLQIQKSAAISPAGLICSASSESIGEEHGPCIKMDWANCSFQGGVVKGDVACHAFNAIGTKYT